MAKSITQRVYEYLLDLPAGYCFHSVDLMQRQELAGITRNQMSAALDDLEKRGALLRKSRVGKAGGGCRNNYEWTNEERHLTFAAARKVPCRNRGEGAVKQKASVPLENRFATLSDELLHLAAVAEHHRAAHKNSGTRKQPGLSRGDVLLACAERAEELEKRIAELEQIVQFHQDLVAAQDRADARGKEFWGNRYARPGGWMLVPAGDGWVIKRDPLHPTPFPTDEAAVQFVRDHANEMHDPYYHDAWELAGKP